MCSYQDSLSNVQVSCELQQHLRGLPVCGGLALSLHHSRASEKCPKTSVSGFLDSYPFLTLQLQCRLWYTQDSMQHPTIYFGGMKTINVLHVDYLDLHTVKYNPHQVHDHQVSINYLSKK